MEKVSVVAIDMGSSSVRAVLGTWDGENLYREEIYRCAHQPLAGTPLTWDILTLQSAAKTALAKATALLGNAPHAIAIDGWGVDCIFTDGDNQPLSAARCYRDPSGAIGREKLSGIYSEKQLYRETGVLPQDINTCYQIAGAPAPTGTLMFLADYIAHQLVSPATPASVSAAVASTSGLVKTDGTWHFELAKKIGIAAHQLPPITPELSIIGHHGETAVIRAGSHDTACAAHSLPRADAQFISCGSWAIAGVITDAPITTDAAYRAQVTNEAATNGKNRAELNLTGLWVAQECRRTWAKLGYNPSYRELAALTEQVPIPAVTIEINDPRLTLPGKMPEKVAELAKEVGITVETPGQIMRLVTESLAVAQAAAIKQLRQITNTVAPVYLIGGGVRDEILVQRTAAALGEEIYVADPEASALGNILAQLQTLGVAQSALDAWLHKENIVRKITPNERKTK